MTAHSIFRARGTSLLLLAAVAALVFSGCGGGGGDSNGNNTPSSQASPTPAPSGQSLGSVRLTVQWPSRTGRLIPLASQSLVVVFQDAAHKELARSLPARPNEDGSTTEVRFTGAPAGDYFVSATAYPNADGTGAAQAQATVPLSVASGIESTLNLSLQSIITNLTVNPSPLPAPLPVGRTVTLSTAARDANGTVILTSPAQLTWQTSDANIATVDANGVVTGVSAGQATITVRDTESGNAAPVAVVVTDVPAP